MDKNMIKIDDLFRQQLGDREEEVRPGAWIRMRELLDEEMPNRTAGIINWRRMLGYAAGLAALACLGVGGYEMTTAHRGHNEAYAGNLANVEKTANATTGNMSRNSVVASSQVGTHVATAKDENTSSGIIAAPAEKEKAVKKATASSKVAIATQADKDISSVSGNQPDNKNNDDRSNKHIGNTSKTALAASLPRHARKNNKILNTSDNFKTSAANNASADAVAANNAGINTTTSASANDATPSDNTKLAKRLKAHKASFAYTPDNNVTTANKTQGAKKVVIQHNVRPVTTNTYAGAIGNNKRATFPLVTSIQKDSIDKLVVMQHYVIDPETRIAYIMADTISRARIPSYADVMIAGADKLNMQDNAGLAANTKNDAANKQNNWNPNSANKNNTVDNTNGDNANLAKKKLHRSGGWDWSAFSQRLHDFEYNLGHVKIYPGVIGGVNATFFGPTSGAGFHFGFTGEFVFDDRWSMMAEFKYMQRFSSGVLNNNYTSYNALDSTPSANGTSYYLQQNNTQHYFNYSTLHSLELPISMRYKAGNFYIYAGANLVYNFSITPEEISHTVTTPMPNTEIPNGVNWRSLYKTTPVYTINDFSSRFGMGYLFGLSYEFTPSVMVDFRATQTLWDNANTEGAKQISSTLYKSPSMQLSIIYRLNHKKSDVIE